MTREVILLLLRCLSTEPELCDRAMEAAARDPDAARVITEAVALAKEPEAR